MINIFTDGAASGNPGPGGFAVIMKFNKHRKEFSQGFRKTTNNRMELLAVVTALEMLKTDRHPITIHTDSKYVSDSVNKKWVYQWKLKNFKNKKNKDLWLRFLNIFPKFNAKIIWVKGHAGNMENENCDKLAVLAYQQYDLLIDEGYERNLLNIEY